MTTQVILLNGGSSSGKSSIARCLQAVLPQPWLTFGVDSLIEAMPSSMKSSDGIDFADDGQVHTTDAFRRLDVTWGIGLAAMAHAGARIIIDEVFLGQAASQDRWRSALDGLDVLWVGVRCDSGVAERREMPRGNRVIGMARAQADLVHHGVSYDVEVDTATSDSTECARIIAHHVS